VDVLSLGVPEGASITADLQDATYETIPGQDVAPEATYLIRKSGESTVDYAKDPHSYGRDEFLPVQVLNVSPPCQLRMQRVVSVTLSPYQYNPAKRVLRKITSGRLVIRYATPAGRQVLQAAGAERPDPYYEDIYCSILANHSESRGWRTRGVAIEKTGQDSTRDWFETGRTYFRIPVARDGWYRVTSQDIPGLDSSTARIFYRGKQVPLVVRPDRSVEFYGLRHRGDSTYLDYFTDTSSYWLTSGGAQAGVYFREEGPIAGAAVDTISSSAFTVHLEQNQDYYEGTTQSEITDNGTVPGEGWVWEYFYPGTTSYQHFLLDAIDSLRGPVATLRVRVQSTTLHYNTPDHRVKFWVNFTLVGDLQFTGREGVTANFNFPASLLKAGDNLLTIMSEATASSPNQFYLDWCEVEYRRLNTAVQDLALLDIPAETPPRTLLMTAEGFHTASLEIYDLTTHRKLRVGAVTGDSAAGYTVRFVDTVGIARKYVVVSQGGVSPAGGIQAKTFSDIRQNSVGADYIVLTHSNFLSAAQRLAAHRATANGVRTRVVDVQDVYDEFNYGHLATDPIKAYLSYAYQNWPGVPPSFLVLFGDASWDFHRYMSTTIKTNFVPAYGVPAGDNWYVCFDPSYPFIPSMMVGRIPVETAIQAEGVVDKLIMYDGELPAEWNKNFMFISGGTTPAEQASFNGTTNLTVNTYVASPPIGGTAFKIYKTTPEAIEGEHREEMRDLVKRGLSFINFLGHSGGRFWQVDIGDPATLENTMGQLPFVSSVSCNIASFAEPSNTLLAEDFLLTENRGGIAAWGSSSLGYANIGSALVNLFLAGVANDTLRGFGALTTAARIQMWQQRGSDYISIASVNLNPLIGDPLTSLALARNPDLALTERGIQTNAAEQSAADSILAIKIALHNYGLVPPDSVGISLTDTYASVIRGLLDNARVPPVFHRDSLVVPWRVLKEQGAHTLTAVLDPRALLPDVNRSNNSATANEYVFGNEIAAVRPFDNMVVSAGAQTLVAAPRRASDSTAWSYEFEVDTTLTFDSPALMKSGLISGAPVGARWTTPQSLAVGAWFWRVRSLQGAVYGQWVVAGFSVSGEAPVLPAARWKQSSPKQFARGAMARTSATDSGVALAGRAPFHIVARSLGGRWDMNRDYFSYLRINDQVMLGYWWANGTSFMVLRADEVTGAYEFRPFDVAGDTSKATQLTSYLNSVRSGEVVAITVVWDGYTNVTPALRQAFRYLGSMLIDSVRFNDSWMLISRMGPAGLREPILEHWSTDGVAVDSITLNNYYTDGGGTFASPAFPYPAAWTGFHVRGRGLDGVTALRSVLVGARRTGVQDTLVALQGDSIDLELASLSGRVLADSAIAEVSLSASLTTGDGITTPVLREWWLDLQPPQELAISPRTIEAPAGPVDRGGVLELPVTVHNIGFRTSTPSSVQVFLSNPTTEAVAVADVLLDSIPPDGSRRVIALIPTSALSGDMTATVKIIPRPESHDLIVGNNQVRVPLTVAGGPSTKLLLFADGTQLMDGDYVAVRPTLIVQLQGWTFDPLHDRADLYIDGARSGTQKASGGTETVSLVAGNPTFNPTLTEGTHELQVVLVKGTLVGFPDTVAQQVNVNVEGRFRILNLYNYPNPFQRETYFTFVLAGAEAPEEVRIRIYTVAGRKIQQLTASGAQMQIGFNRVYWDGRDIEGDEIANGTYLYQVEVRAGGTVVVESQKLVRLR
jgi:hypothetical protein